MSSSQEQPPTANIVPEPLGAATTSYILPTNTRLYFAYGSNLSPTQMSSRCPSSSFVGLARIPGYKFIINARGYANVVPVPATSTINSTTTEEEGVIGVLYEISEEDEDRLDGYEGVPWAYEKVEIGCFLLEDESRGGKGEEEEKEVKVLVYIDTLRTKAVPEAIRQEYVGRMNRGIEEAMGLGMPEGYVEGVLRGFIPVEEGS
ncbi:hypothetical protein GE09DRAFT_1283308 [Coniochaeta sp. 2T2.1]|nr:hypothetical protein GE09DRAFT_1283308 [Coniochaeta sp. 2T2.1]